MSNIDFAPFQGLKPTPSGRIPEAQDQENQGIARPACRMREQANPQIDADIVKLGTRLRGLRTALARAKKKGHFWMETN